MLCFVSAVARKLYEQNENTHVETLHPAAMVRVLRRFSLLLRYSGKPSRSAWKQPIQRDHEEKGGERRSAPEGNP